MPNMIKLPIYNSGPTDLYPRFTCLNVEDVYSVDKAATSGSIFDIIHVHYSTPAAVTDGTAPQSGKFLRASIDYTRGTTAVVTDQDIENLKDLIKSANQNPSSTPEFALIGARDATISDIEDFQVVDIQIKAEAPV
jgi:hypothetical protein